MRSLINVQRQDTRSACTRTKNEGGGGVFGVDVVLHGVGEDAGRRGKRAHKKAKKVEVVGRPVCGNVLGLLQRRQKDGDEDGQDDRLGADERQRPDQHPPF